MQTNIHEKFRGSDEVQIAESILRACVHCGFCNATCPTYLELGDERDGPRGRIYLMKQMLESGDATELTRTHLDRCLTCRNCETTCPSGVRYGRLLDIGRGILERDLGRSPAQSLQRRLIQVVVPYPKRFSVLLRIARAFGFLVPRALRKKIPVAAPPMLKQRRSPKQPTSGAAPPRARAERTMIVLAGCAQAAATPGTNTAARRVLERLGIALEIAPQAGCCGALHYHLGEHEAGRDFMRANIDAWWPLIEDGAEAVVVTASGCGATIREYGELLADDERYAVKAQRVADMSRDIVEILDDEDLDALQLTPGSERIALHCPCTLQHAQRLGGTLQSVLARSGMNVVDTDDAHLCCGSAGSYSLLQPQLSQRLKERKLAALTVNDPDLILTANVGCQLHLASGAKVPVRHWIEAIDASMGEPTPAK